MLSTAKSCDVAIKNKNYKSCFNMQKGQSEGADGKDQEGYREFQKTFRRSNSILRL